MKTNAELAREAGLMPEKSNVVYQDSMFEFYIERFAELARADERADLYKEIHDPLVLACKKMVADEREACAKVAEMTPCQFDDYKRIAEAIRARGNT